MSSTGGRAVRAPRVLVIAPSLDMLGGQSRQCARLLAKLKEEPSLYVEFLPVNPRLPKPFHLLQKIKYARTIFTTLYYWLLLLLKAWRFDVLHIFSASYYSYMLSVMPPVLLGKLLGKKTILNYRSGEADDHLTNWRTAIPSMKKANVIVTPSGYLVDVFSRYGLTAQFIYNIIELDRFTFRDRAPLRPVFLTTRLLEPLYNVPCVLRAFKLIQEKYPQASLTVGGEGFMREELEQLAKDLELKNTTFIGGTKFEDMPALYDSADIYLTATSLDNMPSSVTECLAAGLPVVTTNAGGIPYIVEHEKNCLMVEINDHKAMAESAIRFLEDEELTRRITREGREHSRQWTWEAVRDEWVKLYHKLADSKEEKFTERKLAAD